MTEKQPSKDHSRANICALSNDFATQEGRRPRLLVATADIDKALEVSSVASGFADLGFDVDISPPFGSMDELAMQALDNDIHFLLLLIEKSFPKISVDELSGILGQNPDNHIFLVFKSIGTWAADGINSEKGNAIFFGPEAGVDEMAHQMLSTYALWRD